MCKRSPTQVGKIRTIAGIPSSWSCPMTFCRGWPSWAAETLCPLSHLHSSANWIQFKILHRQGLRALPGGELTWRCTFLILETGAGPALGTRQRTWVSKSVMSGRCKAHLWQGIGAGDKSARHEDRAARGSTGRRVSVVSMIRPIGECVRRDPWFAVRKVSVLMAGDMPKAERPD